MSGRITIRDATMADMEDLLAWRNDPLTRQMSKSTGLVAQTSHAAWLRDTLSRDDRVLLIACTAQGKAGVVRFDLAPNGETEVSINLNPAHRGQGLAAAALRAALDVAVPRLRGQQITARIRSENHASIRAFAACGFVSEGREDGLERWVWRGDGSRDGHPRSS